MAWTSPRTWLAGEDPPASVYNTHVRDNLKAIGDTWTAYTPVWTGETTNPVIGNGTLTGAYSAAGKRIAFVVRIVTGSTTTYGSGAYRVSLPFAALNQDNPGLCGWWNDNSAAVPYGMIAIGVTTGAVRMLPSNSTSYATSVFPFTLAQSDKIMIGGTYEAA